MTVETLSGLLQLVLFTLITISSQTHQCTGRSPQTLYQTRQSVSTHPCVFWYQSALMRLEVRMMTLKPSSYHSNIIFLQSDMQQRVILFNTQA